MTETELCSINLDKGEYIHHNLRSMFHGICFMKNDRWGKEYFEIYKLR